MDVQEKGRLAEETEAATVESLVGLMPPDLRDQLGVVVRRFGGGLGVRMAAFPDLAYLCRVFAVGVSEPVTGEVLDEAVEFLRVAGGSTILVQLAPFAETDAALAALADRGFERGGTWSKLMRPVGDPPAFSTDLRIAEVGPEHAKAFGMVEAVGMGMPPFMVTWCAAQVGAPDWRTYGAFDGDDLVAVGATFRRGDVVQLSGAATLPDHRGRGAQIALMARRMEDARDAGARWVIAETASETPEEPNPSLHNMHRAGLELLYERRNWLLRL